MDTIEIIVLQGVDIDFSKIAQGARVDGATLPSGLKVPITDGRQWVVTGSSLWCINDVNEHGNVQTGFPE